MFVIPYLDFYVHTLCAHYNVGYILCRTFDILLTGFPSHFHLCYLVVDSSCRHACCFFSFGWVYNLLYVCIFTATVSGYLCVFLQGYHYINNSLVMSVGDNLVISVFCLHTETTGDMCVIWMVCLASAVYCLCIAGLFISILGKCHIFFNWEVSRKSLSMG